MKITIQISLLFLLFFLQSCKDNCKDLACNNGGTCEDGICNCLPGFTGTNCENQDLCHNITCGSNGNCVNGICVCTAGYEGTLCDTRSSTKFVGSYTVNDTCGFTAPTSYTSVISDSTTALLSLKFRYLWFFTGDIFASLNPDGSTFTIPNQTATTSFGSTLSISGTGTRLSNGNIVVNFVADGDNCRATMVRQ